MSFTIRERFVPDNACSTPTLTLDILLLVRFSDFVNSFLRGFFWADEFLPLAVHNPETLCLYIKKNF